MDEKKQLQVSFFVLYKQQQTTKYKELNIKVDNLNETLETFQKTCVKLKDYFIEDNKLRSKINKSNEEIIKIFEKYNDEVIKIGEINRQIAEQNLKASKQNG